MIILFPVGLTENDLSCRLGFCNHLVLGHLERNARGFGIKPAEAVGGIVACVVTREDEGVVLRNIHADLDLGSLRDLLGSNRLIDLRLGTSDRKYHQKCQKTNDQLFHYNTSMFNKDIIA